jgi:hypothetical protein
MKFIDTEKERIDQIHKDVGYTETEYSRKL